MKETRLVLSLGILTAFMATALFLPGPVHAVDIIVDNADPGATITWPSASNPSQQYGTNFQYDISPGGADTATWTPTIPQAGNCEVYAWWVSYTNRASNAPYTIIHSGGSETIYMNQQVDGGMWNLLGTFPFAAGSSGYVQLTDDANGVVIADAIKFECPCETVGSTPNWPITQDGTNYSVSWVDHTPNPRFAVYDPGTSGDLTDDVVLDKETGLVWERTPDNQYADWNSACAICYTKFILNRRGWRIPTLEELGSLVYNTGGSPPCLPSGHPFNNILDGEDIYYWTKTTVERNSTDAFGMTFNDGFVQNLAKGSGNRVWCVRGGVGYDGP